MADIIEKIQAELANIGIVFNEVKELNEKGEFDKYQISAGALCLCNFYNGAENIYHY